MHERDAVPRPRVRRQLQRHPPGGVPRDPRLPELQGPHRAGARAVHPRRPPRGDALSASACARPPGGRHIAPHTAYVAALWAVLSRMRKPQIERFPSTLAEVIGKLTPLDKVELYSTGQRPRGSAARSRARARRAHQGPVPRVGHVSDLRGPRRCVAARDADRAARGRGLDSLRLRVAARRPRRDRRAVQAGEPLRVPAPGRPAGRLPRSQEARRRRDAAGCSIASTTRCASRSASSRSPSTRACSSATSRT